MREVVNGVEKNEEVTENVVEGELVHLECCTNGDANPPPVFEWHRTARANLTDLERVSVRLPVNHVHHHSSSLIKSNQELVRHGSDADARLCNRLRVNLTRFDNLYVYRCMISNEALVNRKPIEDSLSLTVECKHYTFTRSHLLLVDAVPF